MQQAERQTILEVQKLQVEAKGKQILDEIDLTLHSNEVLAVIGETGSGKTMTFMSLLGLNDRDLQVSYDLLNIFECEKAAGLLPSKIAVVFQNAQMAFNPIKRCGVQISRVLRKQLGCSKQEANERIESLLEQVGIRDIDRIKSSFPHQVSGGELQRVMIAMALSCSPELLILDEPTASIDKILQKQFVELILKIKKDSNLTIVLISHDLPMVSSIADRIIHIHKGRKIADQKTYDFFQHPEHEVSQRLLAVLKSFHQKNYQVDSKSEVSLSVVGATKVYDGKKTAFENIDLDIRKGEKLGIIGESGSGKSSLAKCIAGIEEFTKGNIDPKSHDLKITYVYQDAYNSMDPDLTIAQILHEVIRLQKQQGSAKSLLAKVLLEEEILQRKIHQLSGGQRQRVNLARALASNPDIIICDEITSGLDVNVQYEIIDLLSNQMCDLTVIFISHDISLIKFFCNRACIMKNGRMVEIASTKKIFDNPQSKYTTELINSLPDVKYFLNI